MATDRDTLLGDAVCYLCATPGQQQLLKLGLLRQILLALTPMADTSRDALLESAKCYACATPGQWQLLELGLLKQIADSGLGTGSGSVLCSASSDPVADPGVDCATYFRLDTGNMWVWNDGAGVWNQLF